ncbi:hypothetical protein D3C72_1914350 [compost metagenome]
MQRRAREQMRTQGQSAVVVVDAGGVFRLCDRDQPVNGDVGSTDAGRLRCLRRRLNGLAGRARLGQVQHRGRQDVISGAACILVVQHHAKGVCLVGRG